MPKGNCNWSSCRRCTVRPPHAIPEKISITLKVSDFFWQDRTCNSTATRCNTSINIYGKSWDWEKSFDQQIARAQNTSLIWSHYFVPIELCQTSHDLGQELRLCDPPVPCPGAVQFQSDRFALFSNLGFSVNNVDSSTTGKTVSSTYSSTFTICHTVQIRNSLFSIT